MSASSDPLGNSAEAADIRSPPPSLVPTSKETLVSSGENSIEKSTSPLLEIEGLHAEYFSETGSIPAVDGVTLSVQRNRVLGVVGESGCGKSTLAYAVMGLIDEVAGRVTSRKLSLAGEDLLKKSQRELNRIRGSRMAMVFQNPASHLDPVYTVENQIGEVIRYHENMSRKSARKRALTLLERVGIPDAERHLTSYPHQLSGGMQQRVMIAIALACSPELLIADEPTTALDVTIQAQIMELILQLKNELGMGIMLITHDMGVIAEMADEVAVMYAGNIVETGETHSLFTSPRHPYTRGLLASIPSTERDVARLPTIPGVVPTLESGAVGCKFADRCPIVMSVCHARTPTLFPSIDKGESKSDGSIHRSACWNDPEAEYE